MTSWTEKYRPTTKSEVRGNNKARDSLWEWAETWDDHRQAVIIYGSPGIGKTSAAHALANDMGWGAVELNASDDRTAEAIERYAGRAARNTTLAGSSDLSKRGAADRGRQLVIMDEADNIHHRHDHGGAQAVTELVKEAGQPVVLVANEFYEMSNGLRNACESIQFRDVSASSIRPVLRDICRQEGVEFEPAALEALADQNAGDLRGAINDLQAIVGEGGQLTEEDLVTSERDQTHNIFAFLDAVLKEESPESALRTAYDTDETPDDLLLWVHDKAPKVFEGDELVAAYEFLRAADRWLGRIRATQNYTYWRYATDNLAAGVASARERDRGGWTRYGGAPYRSTSDAVRDHVARKIAEASGVSIATGRREILPFLETMTHHCRNRELTVAMAAAYDLDAEHVAFVTGSGEETNKVQSIVDDARQLQDLAGDTEGELVTGDGEPADSEPTAQDAEIAATAETDEGPTDEDEDDQQSGLGDFV